MAVVELEPVDLLESRPEFVADSVVGVEEG